MFSNILGALVSDAAAPAADADTTAGLVDSLPSVGGAGKVLLGAAGVAAAGGLAYAAYKHFKTPGADAGALPGAQPQNPFAGAGAMPQGAAPQPPFGGAGGGFGGFGNVLGPQMGQAPAPSPGPSAGPSLSAYANDPSSWGAPVPSSTQVDGLHAPTPGGVDYGGPPTSQAQTTPAPPAYSRAAQTMPTPPQVDFPPAQGFFPPMPPRAQTVVSPPSATPAAAVQPRTAPSGDVEAQALLLVRAMVTAASIDGVIDPDERQRIVQRVSVAGLGAAERAALEQELAAPQPACVLLGQVRSREMAEQFYVVSLLGVACDTEAERAYLRGLPYVLGMRAEDVARLHARLGVAPP